MTVIARDEGLIRASQMDSSKWNIVKTRLLKRESESSVKEEQLPADNP